MNVKLIFRTTFLVATLLTFSSGCVKKKCGYFVELNASSLEVTEGSSVTITGTHAGSGLNMTYIWYIPNMTGITSTTAGGISTSSPRITIEDFGPEDVGTYRLVVYPDRQVCGETEATLNLTLKTPPVLNSPCLSSVGQNTMIEKYSNGTEHVFPIIGTVIENQTNNTFRINLSSTITGHEFIIYFKEPLPTSSSSYTLLDYWNSSITNSATEASIRYYDPSVTAGFYELDESISGNVVYLKRENNTLTVSFCSRLFQGSFGTPNEMSAHAIIQL